MDAQDRPNYYLLLGIEPDADDAVVAAAVRDFQLRNSREKNPLKLRQAQENLERLADVRRVLGDPALRRVEAEAAVRLRRAAERELFDELDALVRPLATEGHLLPAQFDVLTQRFKGRLDPERVRARLVELGVDVRDAPQRSAGEELDRGRMGEIADRLRRVGRDDLYDLLGLPADAETADLLEAARRLDREARSEPSKTAAVTARAELAGWCLALFRDDAARSRYDRARAEQPLWELDGLIDLAAAGGRVPAAVVGQFLRQARDAGVADDSARDYLRRRAAAAGCPVEWPGPRPEPAAPADGSAPAPWLVEWRFDRKGYFTQRVEAVVEVTGVTGRPVRLLLIGQVNRTPDGPDDGDVIAEWELGDTPPDGELRRPVAVHRGRGKIFCKLFARPAAAATILHPEKPRTAL